MLGNFQLARTVHGTGTKNKFEGPNSPVSVVYNTVHLFTKAYDIFLSRAPKSKFRYLHYCTLQGNTVQIHQLLWLPK